jgi:KUP system potassium uptake protein
MAETHPAAGRPEPSREQNGGEPDATRKAFWLLSLTALGVVFGDIATSPIYAIRE